MDDKYEKRAEMIKRYNKNISDEELEEKLRQMEFPEEYEKVVQAKREEREKKMESQEVKNRLYKKIRPILGVVLLFVGVVLTFTFGEEEILGFIGRLLVVTLLLILPYYILMKVEIYILRKLGIKVRIKSDYEMRYDEVGYRREIYHDSRDDANLNFSPVEITDDRPSKKTLGEIILIIFYILFILCVLLVGFLAYLLIVFL